MILNEAVALTAALRELLGRLGRMENPGCQLGGTPNLSSVRLGKRTQWLCKDQWFQILRPASSARWTRSSFIVELGSSGLSASETNAYDAPVHGEERRRAANGGHPTGAGASARREKSLQIALLVPAYLILPMPLAKRTGAFPANPVAYIAAASNTTNATQCWAPEIHPGTEHLHSE
jgi:hypothetical protein